MGMPHVPEELPRLDYRERRFVQEMLLDPDVTRAAVAAGYSRTTAETLAYQWIRESEPLKPHVVFELERMRALMARKVGESAERIREELALIAHSDIGDVAEIDEESGNMRIRPLGDLTPRERRAICEITQTRTERWEGRGKDGPPDLVENVKTSVKMHPKTAALRMLMDHLGMDAPKRTEHSGPGGGPIEHELRGKSADELLATMLSADAVKRGKDEGEDE